jgi:uncharacterized repeat protein (TIGR03803 family)
MNPVHATSRRMIGHSVLFMFFLTLVLASATASAQTFKVLFDGDRGTGTNTQDFKFTQAWDGNLYVTANQGGPANGNCLFGCGQILAMTTAGAVIPVHEFDFASEGASPRGGLTLGTDGNLYGVLSGGGTTGFGSIFKITTGGVFTILHAFSGSDGNAFYPPIQATDGNFYGTTSAGGFNGSLYKLTPSGNFTVLHGFNRNVEGDGGGPLVQGVDGKLYTAAPEGTSGGGTILQFTTKGKLKILHNFPLDRSEGYGIFTPVQAPDGNFYGVCNQGGAQSSGTVWKISPTGAFTLLYSLNGTTDGQYPGNRLSLGTDGKLYGSTEYQGVNGGAGTGGTLFRVTTAGAYSVLFGFTGGNAPSGSFPNTVLTQDTNGLFYGITAFGGGPDSDGTFYELDNTLAPFAALQTTSGTVGAHIGILGQGFGNSSVVKFGGTPASTITVTGTTFIMATVPHGALTGPVTVTTGSSVLSSPASFKVLPTITGFTPPSGAVGTAVTITGSGLTQSTKVAFGTKAAAFSVNSDTQVTAIVPAGAITGKIGITTKGGKVSSKAKFTVN